MNLNLFIFCSVMMISDGFIIRSRTGPLVAPLGSSVVLPCYVDEALPMKGLKVLWMRTDSNTLVHLFVYGESRPEDQHQDYHHRAHFFTDEIIHGNFSLRLDNLRAEDKGLYRCKVYAEQDASETFVEIKAFEHLSVSGSDESISASVGEDVTLNCFVDFHITPEEVSWRKTDKDENILVLLYQNNETLPEASDKRYRDRVEFFTAEIPKGKFSLRLKSVRTEDKGLYMCHVKTRHLSANTTVIIERLGFSVLHTMILALCIIASGSALILWLLIYCTLQNEWIVSCLQICLIFLPNIMMLIAVILWGSSEGFHNETVACSALYLLRPNMLVRAAPYAKMSEDIMIASYGFWSFIEYSVFTGIVYSDVLKYGWEPSLDSDVFFLELFLGTLGILLLLGLLLCLMNLVPGWRDYNTVSETLLCAILILMAILMFYFFCGALNTKVFFGTGLLPLLLSLIRSVEDPKSFSYTTRLNVSWAKSEWLSDVIAVNAVMICFYIIALENHEDCMGWACVIGFLQIQWSFMDLTWSCEYLVCPRSTFVYLFGSVGVILLNSSTLMSELILKILNGERTVGDLRIVLFLSESIFTLSLLTLEAFAPGNSRVVKGYNSLVLTMIGLLFAVACIWKKASHGQTITPYS